jgi:hypothetical protein
VLPRTSVARHAKASGSAEQGELDVSRPFPVGPADEAEFDFSRPFLLDVGRAAVIAEWLRESGYPRCTADVVIAELARPERERSAIGRFAADLLERARWRP